jgi:hypothetical protein
LYSQVEIKAAVFNYAINMNKCPGGITLPILIRPNDDEMLHCWTTKDDVVEQQEQEALPTMTTNSDIATSSGDRNRVRAALS